MKHKFLFSVVTVLSWVILMAGVKAQETQQKRMHITIEENGKISKDTSVTIDKSMSEKEVQAIISGITGEIPHPCPAHQQRAMQGDSTAGKCMHRKEVEIRGGSAEDSDIKVIILHNSPGQEPVVVEDDGDVIIIRKGHGQGTKCLKEIHEMEADSLPCKKTKEIKIIEISDENADGPEWVEKKVIEKKVIITEEGEKAEKTIIMESPEKTKKAEKKVK